MTETAPRIESVGGIMIYRVNLKTGRPDLLRGYNRELERHTICFANRVRPGDREGIITAAERSLEKIFLGNPRKDLGPRRELMSLPYGPVVFKDQLVIGERGAIKEIRISKEVLRRLNTITYVFVYKWREDKFHSAEGKFRSAGKFVDLGFIDMWAVAEGWKLLSYDQVRMLYDFSKIFLKKYG